MANRSVQEVLSGEDLAFGLVSATRKEERRKRKKKIFCANEPRQRRRGRRSRLAAGSWSARHAPISTGLTGTCSECQACTRRGGGGERWRRWCIGVPVQQPLPPSSEVASALAARAAALAAKAAANAVAKTAAASAAASSAFSSAASRIASTTRVTLSTSRCRGGEQNPRE